MRQALSSLASFLHAILLFLFFTIPSFIATQVGGLLSFLLSLLSSSSTSTSASTVEHKRALSKRDWLID